MDAPMIQGVRFPQRERVRSDRAPPKGLRTVAKMALIPGQAPGWPLCSLDQHLELWRGRECHLFQHIQQTRPYYQARASGATTCYNLDTYLISLSVELRGALSFFSFCQESSWVGETSRIVCEMKSFAFFIVCLLIVIRFRLSNTRRKFITEDPKPEQGLSSAEQYIGCKMCTSHNAAHPTDHAPEQQRCKQDVACVMFFFQEQDKW
jgi:hypothetical protein